MTSSAVLSGARSAQGVLDWARRLLDPALREAVDTLPASVRRIAGYHFGWWDADQELGTPEAGSGVGSGSGTGAGSGKAIRPALALLAAEAVGGRAADAMPAAVAVELVHNFSLIQDDVIDGDPTRRHRPTAWCAFGTGSAIVAADALLGLGYQVLSASGHPAAEEAVGMLHAAVLDLIEGQNADLDFEQRTDVDLSECLRMVEGKTGAMLGVAGALGAWFGGGTAARVVGLRRFGQQLGVAFQLADDLLGIWGDPAVTGKPVYSDLHRRKKTLPVVAALRSGTRAGEQLAARYRQDRQLAGTELAGAAELVELAGGRAWSQARVDELLAAALAELPVAAPVGGPERDRDPARAAAELAALARLAVYRDR